mgnify:CR=1 FL=1
MGIDFKAFKSAFLSQMKNAANLETQDNKINTNKEVAEAKNIQSTFKGQLAGVAEPIGDTFVATTKKDKAEKEEAQEVTYQDLVALLDDKDLNIDRVNQLIEEKPVETLGQVKDASNTKVAKETEYMSGLFTDVDKSKLAFYNQLSAKPEVKERMAKTVETLKEMEKAGFSEDEKEAMMILQENILSE